MIKAAAERALTAGPPNTSQQSGTFNFEPSSYFLDHRNSESSAFEGDSTTSPTPSKARSKHDPPSSRNPNKRRRNEKRDSTDSTLSLPSRNPNNADWNDRRRSDVSGSKSNSSSQRHAADPPRPAKEGMEWVWFPDGYWAERERVEIFQRRGESPRKWFSRSPGRRRSSLAQQISEKTSYFSGTSDVPRIQVSTHRVRTNTSGISRSSDAESRLEKLRLGFSFVSPVYPHFISPTGEPEGLYCKTKRNFEERFVPKRKIVCPSIYCCLQN